MMTETQISLFNETLMLNEKINMKSIKTKIEQFIRIIRKFINTVIEKLFQKIREIKRKFKKNKFVICSYDINKYLKIAKYIEINIDTYFRRNASHDEFLDLYDKIESQSNNSAKHLHNYSFSEFDKELEQMEKFVKILQRRYEDLAADAEKIKNNLITDGIDRYQTYVSTKHCYDILIKQVILIITNCKKDEKKRK